MSNNFCAISTKLKAMRSGHLTAEDYDALLQKHTVNEVCAYLKQTGYGEFLAPLNDATVHRGMLEEYLDMKYEDEFERLYEFAGLEQRKILRYQFILNEIHLLKSVLMRCMSHETLTRHSITPIKSEFFKKHSKIDIDALLFSKNIQAVCDACKNTEYYRPVSHSLSLGSDYAGVCMMLDRMYFENLWSDIKKYVDENQKKEFKNYIGTQTDYLNLMWIYRCKRYFNMPNEMIYTYLIPVFYRLTSDEISKMIESDTLSECEKAIRDGRYGSILDTSDEQLFIEHNYNRLYYLLSKKVFKLNPETISEIFSYFNLLRIETDNIKTIIEGIRYDISPDIIKKYIYTKSELRR